MNDKTKPSDESIHNEDTWQHRDNGSAGFGHLSTSPLLYCPHEEDTAPPSSKLSMGSIYFYAPLCTVSDIIGKSKQNNVFEQKQEMCGAS